MHLDSMVIYTVLNMHEFRVITAFIASAKLSYDSNVAGNVKLLSQVEANTASASSSITILIFSRSCTAEPVAKRHMSTRFICVDSSTYRSKYLLTFLVGSLTEKCPISILFVGSQTKNGTNISLLFFNISIKPRVFNPSRI